MTSEVYAKLKNELNQVEGPIVFGYIEAGNVMMLTNANPDLAMSIMGAMMLHMKNVKAEQDAAKAQSN